MVNSIYLDGNSLIICYTMFVFSIVLISIIFIKYALKSIICFKKKNNDYYVKDNVSKKEIRDNILTIYRIRLNNN